MKKILNDIAKKVAKTARYIPIGLAHLIPPGMHRELANEFAKQEATGAGTPAMESKSAALSAGSVAGGRKPSASGSREQLPRRSAAHSPSARPEPRPERELEDDDEEELHGNSGAAAARGRERARCKAIVMSEVGQRNPVLAQSLAFGTRMTRGEALATLAAVPAPRPRGCSQAPVQAPGAGSASRVTSMLDSWDAARRRNEGSYR
jgi:hypothetical protein